MLIMAKPIQNLAMRVIMAKQSLTFGTAGTTLAAVQGMLYHK